MPLQGVAAATPNATSASGEAGLPRGGAAARAAMARDRSRVAGGWSCKAATWLHSFT